MFETNCKICDGITKEINVKYRLGKCDDCNLVFALEKYSQSELEGVYDELYNKKSDSHYLHHVNYEYDNLKKGNIPTIGYNRKKIIDKYIKPNSKKKVVEIGSGVGLIGKYLEKNDILNYTGIEIDSEVADISRKLGLNIINNDFSSLNEFDSNIDIIMLWEVMEHLQDLKEFITLTHKKLKKGGLLMLSVPNFEKIKNYNIDIDSNDNFSIHQDAPPIHLNFFTKQNLAKIFELNGFRVLKNKSKRLPYLNFKSKNFYKSVLKSILGKYQGSTIYFVAQKNDF